MVPYDQFMALDTITLHGEILAPVTNTPAVGTVTFKILDELRDNGDNVIYSPQTFTATLDVNGEFSIILPVTDQADVTPLDWSYWVYVDTDIWVSGVFYIQLPAALGPVAEFADLLELFPVGSSCTPEGTMCAPIGEFAALQDEIDALELQVDALQADVDDLETQISGFQAQIDALDGRLDVVEADILAIQGDILVIQGQITTINGQIATINGQIATLQGQVATNTTNITTLQGQVTTLQGQVATNTTNITTIQGQIVTIQGQITTLQGQMTTAQGDITTLQTTVSALVGQVNTLSPIVLQNQTDIATLQGNVVYKNPPLVAGSYVGNQVTAPPGSPNTVGWFSMAAPIPFSAGDTNPDFLRVSAIDEFGNTVHTTVWNGNGEGRTRPSTRARVGFRAFESAESVGYSTGQYAQWSSNPTAAGSREPYLGGWGTASAKPGWVEATRVLSGLTGVSIGGTVNAALAPYNTLSAFNYRGLKSTPGAPAAGTWIVNDVVLDSAGVVYRCTVAGTPGTWVGVNAPTAFTVLGSLNANIVLGVTKNAATRIDRGGDNVRIRGFLTATGAVAANAVLGNITVRDRPQVQVDTIARYTGGGARLTITAGGNVSINAALVLNDNVWLDGVTYDQLP